MTKETKKRIAYYCRISTKSQEEKDTIQNQIQEMDKVYSNEKIVKIYKDTFTGASLNRPALNQLREDIKEGLFEVLVIYDLSRLAREPVVISLLLEELEEKVEVKYLHENYENNPEGMLNRDIRASFYKFERHKIKQRTKSGRERNLKNGHLVGGYAPLGYTYHKKTDERAGYHEVNPEEAKIVNLIFDTFIKEQSIAKTTNLMNEWGYTRRSPTLKKQNGFYKTSIRNILKSEWYVGNYWYGKTCMEEDKLFKNVINGERKKRLKNGDKSSWIKVSVPPIINEAKFYQVQKILDERRKNFIRPTKYFYLCSGLIKCLDCGRRYTAKHIRYKWRNKKGINTGENSIYYCPQKDKNHSNPNQPQCKSRQIVADKVDKKVWNYLVNLVKEPNKIKNAVKLIAEKRNGEKESNKKVLTSLQLKREQIKIKKQKILDLYTDDQFSKSDLDIKIGELNNGEERLKVDITKLEAELTEIENISNMEKEIEELCLRYHKTLNKLTPEQRKIVVRYWVKEINITDEGRVKITIKLPELEQTIQEDSKVDIPVLSPQLNPAFVSSNRSVRMA